MRLAFTTLACPAWTIEQAVDAAQRYGYEGIELRLLDGELLTPELDPATRRRVRRLCSQAGLAIVCVDTSMRVAQPDAAERAGQVRAGRAWLELAAEWDCPLIRVFGGPPEGTSEPDAVDAAVACLEPLAGHAQALGVGIALETHDAFARGDTVARVLARLPGTNIGALWDMLHPYRMGEAVEQTARALRGRLRHVHVKDGRRPLDGSPSWQLAPLGEGDVPVPAILDALRHGGYGGWLAVEWEKKWHPELAEPDIALRQHAEVLRQYLDSFR